MVLENELPQPKDFPVDLAIIISMIIIQKEKIIPNIVLKLDLIISFFVLFFKKLKIFKVITGRTQGIKFRIKPTRSAVIMIIGNKILLPCIFCILSE